MEFFDDTNDKILQTHKVLVFFIYVFCELNFLYGCNFLLFKILFRRASARILGDLLRYMNMALSVRGVLNKNLELFNSPANEIKMDIM